MTKRSPFLPKSDAPLRARLLFGWSLFFGLVILGLVIAFTRGRGVPVLLDVLSP